MKKFDEEKNKDFCEEEYFNFEELISSEEKTLIRKFLRKMVYLSPDWK